MCIRVSYYPNLITSLNFYFGDVNQRDSNVQIQVVSGDASLNGSLGDLKTKNNAFYFQVLNALTQAPLEMPPSPGVAGQYVQVDNSRGVWKSPANVNLNRVIAPTFKITDKAQESLNIDTGSGKSINAIRSFTGRGPAISGVREPSLVTAMNCAIFPCVAFSTLWRNP